MCTPHRNASYLGALLLGIVGAVLLAACSMPGDAARVVKVGLIAPFEGVGRPLGYAILPEVRQAVAEANASGELGRYRVALVALNDDLDPATAVAQARALLQDEAVVAVIGPFAGESAAAVGPVLSISGITALVAAPLEAPPHGVVSLCPPAAEISAELEKASAKLAMTPGGRPSLAFFPGDGMAAADDLLARRDGGWNGILIAGPDVLRPWFIRRSGTAAEGTLAAACSLAAPTVARGGLPEADLARAGMNVLIQALAADIRVHDRPSRAGVAEALARQAITPELRWYQVRNGSWEPVD